MQKLFIQQLCNRTAVLIYSFLFLFVLSSFGQAIVSGKVTDSSGNPITGVTVTVKGTKKSSSTSSSGQYSIDAPANAVLSFRILGYKPADEVIGTRTTIDVVLALDSKEVDEVVVVGYNVMKKTDVTGAVASIGQKELKAMPVKDALQAMQGKTAGVDITSNQRPGTTGNIIVRGLRSISATNSPLFVVDGVPLQGSGIENINPSDIETIDVLKDAASTAIYGSRGANGVV